MTLDEGGRSMTVEAGLARAAEILSGATDVALACHLNPDADALGSMLGLADFLRSRGVETTCSFPNEPLDPPRWAALGQRQLQVRQVAGVIAVARADH